MFTNEHSVEKNHSNTFHTNEILFLSPFFCPEPISTGKYNTFLVKALRKHFKNIHVVASHPLYPGWKPHFSDIDLPGTKIHRGGLWLRYPSAPLIRRAILETWYTCYVLYCSVTKIKEIKFIIAIFPPNLFLFVFSKFISSKTKIIGIVHDIQGILAFQKKSFIRNRLSRIIHFIERKSFEKCSKLIFLSNAMSSSGIDLYNIEPTKISIHYPFVTTQTGEPIETTKNINQGNFGLLDLFHTEHKNVVYSGALGEKQNPFALIQLFQHLINANPSIHCHIFSEGPLMEKLKTSLDNKYKDRLFFHDLVPEETLNYLYSCSDLQIIPHVLGASDAAFPSKVPNLLQAGVPIVAICDTDSELDTIIKQSGCGLSVNTWSSDILVKKILEYMVETSSQSHSQRRIHAQSFIEKHFTLNSLVDTILKSLYEES